MAKSDLRTLFYKSLLQMKGRRAMSANQGFTLLEVLVSLVIAGIVVSGLLFVVVELLRVDQREVALDQVQSDMQRALDYMADDLREAIYVYEDPAIATSQLTNLNAEITANGAQPVLAFWRTDEIDVANDTSLPPDNPGSSTDPTGCGTDTTCEVIKSRRASYTLVAYYQRPQYNAWEGESTLKRYELAQYENLKASGTARYNLTPGFSSPLSGSSTGSLNDFSGWTAATPGDGGTSNVLVDYVGAIDTDATNAVNCQALTGDAAHVLVPADATRDTGFFACIRPPVLTGAFRSNQDVFLFLRGDATAASRFLQPASEKSRLPVLQTQVLLGGVIDKDE